MVKKYVFTGPMRSGKTILMHKTYEKLEKTGLKIYMIGEAAQDIIDRETRLEKAGEKLAKDLIVPYNPPKFIQFQEEVLKRRHLWEKEAPKNLDLIVSDRCAIDSLAYLENNGHEGCELYKRTYEYAIGYDISKGFICEFIGDEMIDGNEKERTDLHMRENLERLIPKVYKKFGHELIFVPKFYDNKDLIGLSNSEIEFEKKRAIEKRVELVLSYMK